MNNSSEFVAQWLGSDSNPQPSNYTARFPPLLHLVRSYSLNPFVSFDGMQFLLIFCSLCFLFFSIASCIRCPCYCDDGWRLSGSFIAISIMSRLDSLWCSRQRCWGVWLWQKNSWKIQRKIQRIFKWNDVYSKHLEYNGRRRRKIRMPRRLLWQHVFLHKYNCHWYVYNDC